MFFPVVRHDVGAVGSVDLKHQLRVRARGPQQNDLGPRRLQFAPHFFCCCIDAHHQTCELCQILRSYGRQYKTFVEAIRVVLVDKRRRVVAAQKRFMTAHISTKGHVVHQAFHNIRVQREALRVERGRSVLSSGNDLGDHRIIKNTDLAAVLDGRVYSNIALVEELDC